MDFSQEFLLKIRFTMVFLTIKDGRFVSIPGDFLPQKNGWAVFLLSSTFSVPSSSDVDSTVVRLTDAKKSRETPRDSLRNISNFHILKLLAEEIVFFGMATFCYANKIAVLHTESRQQTHFVKATNHGWHCPLLQLDLHQGSDQQPQPTWSWDPIGAKKTWMFGAKTDP